MPRTSRTDTLFYGWISAILTEEKAKMIDAKNIKLVTFDLYGTLTQHKSKLSVENRTVLKKLSEKYRLLMVGAGTCRRIF